MFCNTWRSLCSLRHGLAVAQPEITSFQYRELASADADFAENAFSLPGQVLVNAPRNLILLGRCAHMLYSQSLNDHIQVSSCLLPTTLPMALTQMAKTV